MNTITGTYGSDQTPCDIIIDERRGWYAVKDSHNVNRTHPSFLVDGVDVETLPDSDCFTWPDGIDSEETLISAIEA